jgi:hypothetical protein
MLKAIRSGFKTSSKAVLRRCPVNGTSLLFFLIVVGREPPQNAHILACMLRFFAGVHLALRSDLRS